MEVRWLVTIPRPAGLTPPPQQSVCTAHHKYTAARGGSDSNQHNQPVLNSIRSATVTADVAEVGDALCANNSCVGGCCSSWPDACTIWVTGQAWGPEATVSPIGAARACYVASSLQANNSQSNGKADGLRARPVGDWRLVQNLWTNKSRKGAL